MSIETMIECFGTSVLSMKLMKSVESTKNLQLYGTNEEDLWKIIMKAKRWEFNLGFKHVGGKRESGLSRSTTYDISVNYKSVNQSDS